MDQWRHGDVQVFALDAAPDVTGLTKVPTPTIALGEVTGHSHRFDAKKKSDVVVYRVNTGANDNGDRIVEVRRATDLVHEEHSRIRLSPGWYRTRIKRQYSAEHGWAPVVD